MTYSDIHARATERAETINALGFSIDRFADLAHAFGQFVGVCDDAGTAFRQMHWAMLTKGQRRRLVKREVRDEIWTHRHATA